MKTKSLAAFIAIVVLVAILATVAAFGVNLGVVKIPAVDKMIKLGLDLRGGASVVLEAKDTANDPVSKDKIDRAIATIRARIDSMGVTEPSITAQGSNRILVELPEIKDTERALEIIGKTAQLKFIDEAGNVILTGSDIKKAQAEYSGSNGASEPVVAFELSSEGAKKFADATAKNIGKIIGIYLDDKAISTPRVNSVIPDGKGIIEGMADMKEAGDLATYIRAGSLPVQLETLSVSSVGPQLGANSFEKTIYAGAIGIIVVFLFMMLYYRVPGLVADVALVLHTVLVLFVLALLHTTLTLPGIAGIILGIGMAVDANILIFERFKEELRTGKTLRAAMDAGFRRAFLTIFDSNMTTILAGVVLFIFGTGPIKGFAVTLVVDVVVNMFTAITVTRHLMKFLIDSNIIKNNKLYSA